MLDLVNWRKFNSLTIKSANLFRDYYRLNWDPNLLSDNKIYRPNNQAQI